MRELKRTVLASLSVLFALVSLAGADEAPAPDGFELRLLAEPNAPDAAAAS